MQGVYIYEAILDAAPVLNPMAKKPEARPYLDQPYPLTNKEQEKREEAKKKARMQGCKDYMLQFMTEFNKRFEGEQEVVTDGG